MNTLRTLLPAALLAGACDSDPGAGMPRPPEVRAAISPTELPGRGIELHAASLPAENCWFQEQRSPATPQEPLEHSVCRGRRLADGACLLWIHGGSHGHSELFLVLQPLADLWRVDSVHLKYRSDDPRQLGRPVQWPAIERGLVELDAASWEEGRTLRLGFLLEARLDSPAYPVPRPLRIAGAAALDLTSAPRLPEEVDETFWRLLRAERSELRRRRELLPAVEEGRALLRRRYRAAAGTAITPEALAGLPALVQLEVNALLRQPPTPELHDKEAARLDDLLQSSPQASRWIAAAEDWWRRAQFSARDGLRLDAIEARLRDY